jgi:hypothetical protein
MPKYSFNYWEETKCGISFEADNLEHAKKLLAEAEEEMDLEWLPKMEKFFKKGHESWDIETLFEEKTELFVDEVDQLMLELSQEKTERETND